MKQSTLSKSLLLILAGVLVCGLFVYFYLVPEIGKMAVDEYPDEASWYMPWLLFIWGTAIPCAIGFVFAWRIALNIGRDKSFSIENARFFKYISVLAAVDAAYFFVGNVVFMFLNMTYAGVVLLSLLIVFAAIAVSVAAAVLSHLVYKAAALQDMSDLTI